MRFHRSQLTRTKALSYFFFGLSVLILASTVYFIFTVQVLKNWTIDIPTTQIHAGDTVLLVSHYTKTRDIDGVAVHYIECKSPVNQAFIRYPINTSVANRQAGTGVAGIPVVVPTNIPGLPETCKFSTSVTYDVLPFKKTYQKSSSKEFTLYPERDVLPTVTPLSQP